MKILIKTLFATLVLVAFQATAQTTKSDTTKKFYIDVHVLTPGKVKFEDVAKAHAKDLATQGKYNASFLKFWVDEKAGLVYCLSSAVDTESIVKTHAEAHGLLPANIYEVKSGDEAALRGQAPLFLDTHYLGAGKVTAADVAAAHQKDLAAQGKHGVNFINYWVNEQTGVVMCLAQAKDSADLIATHKEAHGLIPDHIERVKQGQ